MISLLGHAFPASGHSSVFQRSFQRSRKAKTSVISSCTLLISLSITALAPSCFHGTSCAATVSGKTSGAAQEGFCSNLKSIVTKGVSGDREEGEEIPGAPCGVMALKHAVLGVGRPFNNSVIPFPCSPPSGQGSLGAGLERRGGKVRPLLAPFTVPPARL